jgi:hypothetical protein
MAQVGTNTTITTALFVISVVNTIRDGGICPKNIMADHTSTEQTMDAARLDVEPCGGMCQPIHETFVAMPLHNKEICLRKPTRHERMTQKLIRKE